MIAQPPSVAPAPAHPALHLALLGPPSVAWHGRPLAVDRRQSRALLYRVAAASQPVPRDQLCFLLWPDVPDSAARRNLSVVLTHVRRALPVPDVLLADPDGIALNPAVAASDTRAFAAATGAARQKQGSAHVQAAIEQYRGAFLDGFSLPDCPEFDAWRDAERHTWERRYLDTLATLVDGELAVGNVLAAIAAAVRYLEVDPLAEELQRRLMALYAANGDRAAALTQFERCVIALERELGVDPLPETRAVYEAIRDGHSPLDNAPIRANGDVGPLLLSSRTDDPPLRSPVPAPVTPLLGRDAEVQAICGLLQRDDVRLLTVTGPGGTGKTRLAVAVGAALDAHFADGVVWVPLASLRDPAHVLPAIARALAVPEPQGSSLEVALERFLRPKQLLLILDNVEHLLAAAASIAGLLAVAPALTVLATSRTALHLSGEHRVSLPPLAVPDGCPASLAQLGRSAAAALFLERAAAVQPALPLTDADAGAVAAICRRLDGLPLALELAAARTSVLTPSALLERLAHPLALLTGGAHDLPARHHTLRATLDWSYGLLPRADQHLLARLAVFVGGWTVEAAEAIAGAGQPTSVVDGLAALVQHSLLQRAPADAARFDMLETIREYAAEQLAAGGEVAAIGRRHAAYFLALAEAAAPALRGADQTAVLDQLEREHGNVQAALRWAVDHDDGELALRLGNALWLYWQVRGGITEGRRWLQAALATGATAPAGLRASVLDGAGWLAHHQSDFRLALALHEDSLRLRRALGDPKGIADSLRAVGAAAGDLGDWPRFRQATEDSLARYRKLGDCWGMANALNNLANDVCVRANDATAYPRVVALYAESLELFRELGDRWNTGLVLGNVGYQMYRQGDYVRAQQLTEESLEVFRELGDPVRAARAHLVLAKLKHAQGDTSRVRQHYVDCLHVARQQQDAFSTTEALHMLGYLAIEQGDDAQAQRLVQELRDVVAATGDAMGSTDTLRLRGMLAHAQGHYDAALAQYRAILARCSAIGDAFMSACVLIDVASVRATRGDALSAARLLGAADRVLTTLGAALGIEQARYDRICAAVRTQLDYAEWARAWAQGQAMTLEQAVSVALDEGPESSHTA